MAVVITYVYPVAGGTVPPTVAQAAAVAMVVAQVSMADTDTTTLVTHDFGMSLADGTFMFPLVIAYIQTAGTALPILSVQLTNTLAITVTKNNAAGTGGTYLVTILRPHSIIR